MRGKIFLALSLVVVSITTALGLAATPALAACNDHLLGIPAWYANGVADSSTCEIKAPKSADGPDAMRNFIIKIILNVIQAALMIVGYVAAYFIIKGGFLYVVAQGEPANLTSAKQTITNAIIGLIIALLAAAIVGAVSGAIK